MKIRMLTGLAGIHHSFVVGDVVIRDDEEGQRLIDSGAAELAPDRAEVTASEPVFEAADEDQADPAHVDPALSLPAPVETPAAKPAAKKVAAKKPAKAA